MGKFTPLIGTLSGKIGAMVIDKTGRTRLHAPGPNRTPQGVKNAFAVLAKSWPYSTTGYKALVSDAPGVARGIGYLTGRAYRAYQLAAVVADEIGVDGAGITPYRLSNLSGEFGEGIQLAPFVPTATVDAGGLDITITFGTLPVVQDDSWTIAMLCLSSSGLIAGTIDAEIPGAEILEGTEATPAVTATYTRLTTASAEGMYVFFGAVIAADAVTTLPVCLGFFSGAVEVSS
jgi:hypothetical protein